jgi:hypothetical protein
MADNKYEQIRRRAHEIWESEGRPEGADLRHWQQACDDLGGDNDGKTSQEQRDDIDRDEAALLQGAGESRDIDPGAGKGQGARKRPKNAPSSKPAAPDAGITTGEKSSRQKIQKIKKTEGP